jgi:hypothetical protein
VSPGPCDDQVFDTPTRWIEHAFGAVVASSTRAPMSECSTSSRDRVRDVGGRS